MLLDQALDFKESRQEVPLVTGSVDRVSQGLVIVEGFEGGVEAVRMVVRSAVGFLILLVIF